MRVSVIQMSSSTDKAANVETALARIHACCAADRPQMVILPETFSSLGGDDEAKAAAAERAEDSDLLVRLRETARSLGVILHGGSVIEREGEGAAARYYNTSFVFSAEGDLLARYRKIHLFDFLPGERGGVSESAFFSAGDSLARFDAGGFSIGCGICFDLRFNEVFAAYSRMGCDLICLPSAFTAPTGRAHWEILLRARAIEHQAYIAASAQTGRHQGSSRESYGHAMIVGPWGDVLVDCGPSEPFGTAEIAREALQKTRRKLPMRRRRFSEGSERPDAELRQSGPESPQRTSVTGV